MQITAAVARERFGAFTIETLDLAGPGADEFLVEIVASGMCQTDQHGMATVDNTPLPAVFGHEGAQASWRRSAKASPVSRRATTW